MNIREVLKIQKPTEFWVSPIKPVIYGRDKGGSGKGKVEVQDQKNSQSEGRVLWKGALLTAGDSGREPSVEDKKKKRWLSSKVRGGKNVYGVKGIPLQ